MNPYNCMLQSTREIFGRVLKIWQNAWDYQRREVRLKQFEMMGMFWEGFLLHVICWERKYTPIFAQVITLGIF